MRDGRSVSVETTKKVQQGRGRGRSWRRPQVVTHSAILLLLVLSLLPVYLMLIFSVKNELQYRWERWLPAFPMRLGNYVVAWQVISGYMLNTVFVAGVSCLGVLVLSLIGGFVFARMRFPLKEPLYYAIILLLTVPGILSFIPSFMLYYRFGLLNTIWALIIPNLSGAPVFGIFLMRALLAGIPDELYEAARCDGAGTWSLLWRITLPLSLGGLATLAVLNVIGTWNSFLWPLVVISDRSKQLISVGLYKLDPEVLGSSGPRYAAYVISALPLVLLFVVLGRYYVEGLVESGLKA